MEMICTTIGIASVFGCSMEVKQRPQGVCLLQQFTGSHRVHNARVAPPEREHQNMQYLHDPQLGLQGVRCAQYLTTLNNASLPASGATRATRPEDAQFAFPARGNSGSPLRAISQTCRTILYCGTTRVTRPVMQIWHDLQHAPESVLHAEDDQE